MAFRGSALARSFRARVGRRCSGCRSGFFIVLATTALGVAAAPASAVVGGCGGLGYSYAGLASAERTHGIAATLSAVRAPSVESGHVAAWVGVGGSRAGPGGSDEWLQVGLSAFPGATASRLYYEVKLPRSAARYVRLGPPLRTGERHRVAVLALPSRPHWWRVRVDGRPVGTPVFLPASYGRLTPVATGESWDGGEQVCNGYGYRFGRVALAARPGGSWRDLSDAYAIEDPGYSVIRRPGGSFLAVSRLEDHARPMRSRRGSGSRASTSDRLDRSR